MSTAELEMARPDEAMAGTVQAAVRSRIGRPGDGLEVYAHQGTVTLRGVLASFYQKQLSLHAAKNVAGVTELRDELTVLAYPEK